MIGIEPFGRRSRLERVRWRFVREILIMALAIAGALVMAWKKP